MSSKSAVLTLDVFVFGFAALPPDSPRLFPDSSPTLPDSPPTLPRLSPTLLSLLQSCRPPLPRLSPTLPRPRLSPDSPPTLPDSPRLSPTLPDFPDSPPGLFPRFGSDRARKVFLARSCVCWLKEGLLVREKETFPVSRPKPGRGVEALQRGLLEGRGVKQGAVGHYEMQAFGFKNAMAINPLAELQAP